MTKKVIHVNRQNIALNVKDGGSRPVFTTKIKGKTIYSRGVTINGTVELVQSDTPLSCGARAWIETYDAVKFKDAMSYQDSLTYTGDKQ